MFTTLTVRPRLLTVAALSLSGLAVLVGHPTLARSVGADVWNVPGLNEQMRESAGESRRLDDEDDLVRQRIVLKEAIIAELIAGRATLAQVTDRFAEMNAARPLCAAVVQDAYPGASDREKSARNVIAYALGRVPAEDWAALSARLDAELSQMIAPGNNS